MRQGISNGEAASGTELRIQTLPSYPEGKETALPGFSDTSSLLEVSFQFRYLQTPTQGATGTSSVINFGYTAAGNAVRFGIQNDGTITYSASPTASSRVATGYKASDTTAWTTIPWLQPC
ncbi:MAG TPA: hypothetical protein VNQ90_19380 [Chthoniobacteraceae bacterium]|nr:hypothetical protein [Chthoniobacteraceae bacterium]